MTYQPQHAWLHDAYTLLVERFNHHALILTGDAGSGVDVLALSLASAWLDPQGQAGAPIAAGAHPDLHVLIAGKATDYISEPFVLSAGRYIGDKPLTVISVEMVRELIDQVHQSPMMSANKVVVIINAETMSLGASNGLLKVLEEPPLDTKFILTSYHYHDLMPTIRSRGLQYHVSAAASEEIPAAADAWQELTNFSPILSDRYQAEGYDTTWKEIERVMPVVILKPSAAGEAARLLAERKDEGLWECLFVWLARTIRESDFSTQRRLFILYQGLLELSRDARSVTLDTRLHLHALFSRTLEQPNF